MRLLLLNLPWREGNRLGVRAGSRWPFTCDPGLNGRLLYVPFPFFLAYTDSLLKKEEENPRLIDAIASGLSEIELMKEVKRFAPELMIVETSTPSFDNDIRIMREIRRNSPSVRIVLCGPHASTFPEEIISRYSFIDYVLLGEYEYTVLDLVRCLKDSGQLSLVSGLAYRSNGAVILNGYRRAISNLDNLPWPERESLPMHNYNDAFCGLPQPNFQMWTSRGCPFQCSFCLWPQVLYRERRYRTRNPIDVVNELESVLNRFDFKAVFFDDDIFNVDRNHVLGVCNEILKRKIKVPWAAMGRADIMTRELLDNMVGSGLYAIKYGIESADDGILTSCKKSLDLLKAKRMIQLTKSLGVKVHLTFCLGLPGETKDTLHKTVNFINETSPDSTQFSFATPFPGTEYFDYLRNEGKISGFNWDCFDGNIKYVVKGQGITFEELKEIKDAFGGDSKP